jgi:hypothetical protein
MHGPNLMQTSKAINNLFKKSSGLIFSESFLGVKIMFQIATITKLSGNKNSFVGCERVDKFNNVIVSARLQYFDLGFDQFFELWSFLHQSFGNSLDSDLTVVSLIDCFIYLSEGSLSQYVIKGI